MASSYAEVWILDYINVWTLKIRDAYKCLKLTLLWNMFWNCAGELLLAPPIARCPNQRHREARQGVKASQEWGADAQHWVHVNRGSCDCSQEWSCQTATDHSSLYKQGRESGSQPKSWKALAINRMGPNPSWGGNWDPKSSIKNWLSVNYTQQNRENRSFSQGAEDQKPNLVTRDIPTMWMGRALLGTIFVRWRRRWGMSVAGRLYSFYYPVGLAEACPTASVGCCRPFLGFSRNFCYTSLSMYLTYLFCASKRCDTFPHLLFLTRWWEWSVFM
jgi:hypothetical protein